MVVEDDVMRMKNLLSEAVTSLCRNGMQYSDELRIECLMAITLDKQDVVVVNINKTFNNKSEDENESDVKDEVIDTTVNTEDFTQISVKRPADFDETDPIANNESKREKYAHDQYSTSGTIPYETEEIVQENIKETPASIIKVEIDDDSSMDPYVGHGDSSEQFQSDNSSLALPIDSTALPMDSVPVPITAYCTERTMLSQSLPSFSDINQSVVPSSALNQSLSPLPSTSLPNIQHQYPSSLYQSDKWKSMISAQVMHIPGPAVSLRQVQRKYGINAVRAKEIFKEIENERLGHTMVFHRYGGKSVVFVKNTPEQMEEFSDHVDLILYSRLYWTLTTKDVLTLLPLVIPEHVLTQLKLLNPHIFS